MMMTWPLVCLALVMWAAPARADDGDKEPPCAAPLPTIEAVGQCLGASLADGGPWSILATTPSARLVRVGNEPGAAVYVVAMRAGGWAAVTEVASGRRHAELRAGAASETSLGAHVVARFDVHTDDERRDEAGARATTRVAGERSIFCVVDGRCVSVMTACQAARTTDSGATREQRGRWLARAQLGADGRVSTTTPTADDPARLCERPSASQRLWSEPPAAADRPRWTAPRACTVSAERAHFVDAQTLTPLRAYVVKGDRVEVTPRVARDPRYVVARFRGPTKLTVGLLEVARLDCKAASP